MWEQWNPGCPQSFPCNPTNNESESHGWGAWGVVDMVESLLGISVTSPGAATVRIAPPALDSADLHRASGSAWTQRGTVSAAWKRTAGGMVLDVDVPANVTATVAIPNPGGLHYVGVGAGAPRLVGDQGGRTVFTVGSGATHFSPGAEGTVPVGGAVPPTLSLTLGPAASFGAFQPGVDRTYTATQTANVISTAGDAALTVSGDDHLANGASGDPDERLPAASPGARGSKGAFALPEPLKAAGHELPAVVKTWAAPVSNDPVAIAFSQHIGANDPLRTGTYRAALTFTLSTTNP
jgi:hypothetical protein